MSLKEKLKSYIDYRLIGLAGSILLIISEFLPWFSGFSCLDIYILLLHYGSFTIVLILLI